MPSSNIAQHLSSRFIAQCDRYVHADWSGDEGLLFRARFLIGILIAYQIIIAIALCWVLLLSPMPPTSWIAATVLLGGAAVILHWLMRSLRRSGSLRLAAEFTIATAFVAIQSGIVASGGPLVSAAMSVVVVPPVAAICLVGWRHGLYWGAFVFGVEMLLILAGALGVQYPNVTPPDQIGINRIFAWTIVFTALVGIVLVYETINSHLQLERDLQRQRHEFLATHDLLTGLANRKQLHERLRALLAYRQRKGDVAALVYLDLNGFKQINDSLGHEGGDIVLQIVAQRMQSVARKNDLLARLGGDEFAILMEDIGSVANAEHAVQRLQQAISQTMEAFPEFIVSGSFGIAMAPVVSSDATLLMQNADQAMYLAKKQRQLVVTLTAPTVASGMQIRNVLAETVSPITSEASVRQPVTAVTGTDAAAHSLLSWMRQKFFAHCDRILSPALRADADQLIRGRTLISMARFIQLAMVIIIITLSSTAVSVTDSAIVVAIAVFAAFFSVLLHYLRRTENLAMSINIMLMVAFVTVQASTLINGGIGKSPALDIVVLPVLMAFCLSGRKLGLSWAILTIVFHAAVLIMTGLGIDLGLVDKQQLASETIAAWGIAYIAILCIIYLFEHVNSRLRQERDREYVELEFMATHDVLTGLVNRRRFHDCLAQALERTHRSGESLAVIYLDLDGFKPVNDALGHAVGDVVLQTVAQRIGTSVRSIDTVARLGGDEFAIIVEQVRTAEDAMQVATKVLQEIGRPIGGLETYPVSASIGIAIAPQHSDDGGVLVRMADKAMFRAKATKNAVAVYQ